MNCQEVKIYLHDFVDELLDDKIAEEIDNHIRQCEKCRIEYQKLTRFFDLLKDLPYTIEPPAEIVDFLSNELLKQSLKEIPVKIEKSKTKELKIKREQIKQDRKLKASRGATRKSIISHSITSSLSKEISYKSRLCWDQWSKVFLIFLPLLIIIFGYFIYDFTQINSPWKVKAIQGNYLINGKNDLSGLWHKGSSLYTDDNSNIVIYVPNSCKLKVEPNTYLILLKARNNDNRIKLDYGSIHVSNSVLLPYFSVELEKSIIHFKGGDFSLTAKKNRDVKIFVKFGIVEIEQKGKSYFVDEGHICEIKNEFRVGTPYRFDAPDSLKLEIEKFDYQQGGEASVEKIIKMSQPNDALTLLSLIPNTSAAYRGILFQKIANYFPPPSNVTYEGIIKLNSEMLESWWREIEWQL